MDCIQSLFQGQGHSILYLFHTSPISVNSIPSIKRAQCYNHELFNRQTREYIIIRQFKNGPIDCIQSLFQGQEHSILYLAHTSLIDVNSFLLIKQCYDYDLFDRQR
jgi:hypothetical protein